CRSSGPASSSWTACSRQTSAASPEREPRNAPLASSHSPVHIHPNFADPGRGVGGSSQVGSILFRCSEIHALTRGCDRAKIHCVAESLMHSDEGAATVTARRPNGWP